MSEAPTAPEAAKPASPTEFVVSSAPHLSDRTSTRGIMFEVVLAMLPVFIAAVMFYKHYAVILTLVTVASCLITEAIANAIRKRPQSSLLDGSAIVTGMILAFSLPPMLNPYMAAIGGAIAIALAKAIFGGLGQNLFNPAMVGRAFLMICFPAAMGVWTIPGTLETVGQTKVVEATAGATQTGADPTTQAAAYATASQPACTAKTCPASVCSADACSDKASYDAITMATPLGASSSIQKNEPTPLPSTKFLFVGRVGGSLGETSALAALIGGLYLLLRRIADYRQAFGVLGSAALYAAIAHWADPEHFQGPVFHLTSGAMMFGALFIATDYVGAPLTPAGRWIFGIGVGTLIMTIRLFGAYPEGVMFAILIMNALTPLIERWTTPTPYGGHVATA